MSVRTITLRPQGTKLKVVCKIFETRKQMLQAVRGAVGSIENAAIGFTQDSNLPKGVGAIVYLCRTHLNPWIVAHEMDHVAFTILTYSRIKEVRIKRGDCFPEEERHCGLVEDLIREFNKKVI